MKYVELKREGLPIGSCFIVKLELKSHLKIWMDRLSLVEVKCWIVLVNKYDVGQGLITESWGNREETGINGVGNMDS